MEWGDWFQSVGKQALDTAIEVKYKQPYELQKMELLAYGPYGNPYIEGKPSIGVQQGNVVAGIPQSWLLLGGAVLLVVLLAD